jgi:hypothetical protein
MHYNEILTEVETRWTVFMVFGGFNEPTTGKNFIVVRMPKGRVQWSKKIVPAINKLLSPWHTEEQHTAHKRRKWNNSESPLAWSVEGDNPGAENPSLWDLKQAVARYEWNGSALIPVEIKPT